MTRRRAVAIGSASVLLGIGMLVMGALLATTQTDFGRQWVRRLVVAQLGSALKGRGHIHIGRLDGNLLTRLRIDSVAIRDAEDSIFVSIGPVELELDPRDLLDKRVLVRRLILGRPVVNLRRHANGEWNYRRIFPKGPRKPRTAERRWGDFIVIRSVVLRNGNVTLTEPWQPHESLTGARRDSAISVAIQTRDVRRTSEGLKRSWRWRAINGLLPYARIADPDSIGMLFDVGRMDVDESYPPFRFRNLSGPVTVVGDTLRFEMRHWDLPGSTGRAMGKVILAGSPTRFDVHVVGDSVSLADVNWVYPTLPQSGGGRLALHLRNNMRNPRLKDFVLSDMDVRTTRSHVTGRMTFVVGAPSLIITDVALGADPVDVELLREFNGKPFPVDWQGQLFGTVRGAGGPLTRFRVSNAHFTFSDANVPGALSRFSGSGELDILRPSRTVFRGFDLQLQTLDLRSVRYLFPNFPRLRGTVSGRALLDSSWMDVRFREADITHRDGLAAPTRTTGSGRVTYGREFLTFDVNLFAAPLSFTTFARSYAALPFRGSYTGPLRVRGTTADLDLAARLAGPAGTLAIEGSFDFRAPGFAARAIGSTRELNPGVLLQRTALPSMALNTDFRTDLRGDSLANLDGTLALDVTPSRLDTLQVLPSGTRLTFGGGRLQVDTLHLATDAATMTATGALGLTASVSDTLRYRIRVDSLSALHPYLRPRPARQPGITVAAASYGSPPELWSRPETGPDDSAFASSDTLAGSIALDGDLAGSLAALDTRGAITAGGIIAFGNRAGRVKGTFKLADLLETPRGVVVAGADSVALARMPFASATAQLEVLDASNSQLTLALRRPNGVGSSAALSIARAGDATRLRIDTLRLQAGDGRWALEAPAQVRLDTAGVMVDSLVVRNGAGGSVAFRGTLARDSVTDAVLAIDSMPLADLGLLAQSRRSLGGFMNLDLQVAGTRSQPTMQLVAAFNNASVGTVRVPYFSGRAMYADRTLRGGMQFYRNGDPVLELFGTVPVDLALLPVEKRLLDEPLRGRVYADSVDLAVLTAALPQLERVTGLMSTDVAIGGTWRRPTLSGRFAVAGGQAGLPALGIRLRHIVADIAFTQDIVHIRRLSAASGEEQGDSASVTGTVRVADYKNPTLDLTLLAHNFQAIQSRRLADLALSGSLHLGGSYDGARLDGAITVERGALYLPEQARKQLADVSDPDFFNVVDTSVFTNPVFVPETPNPLIRNLAVGNVQVTVGDEVWLRSTEANVKLGGAVDVTRQGDQLALSGELEANRGTYRLDLGLVQRTFEVTRGSIRFFGEPELNPALDISAVHTVRQANRQDVRIRANIGGTLLQPRLTLSSDERIPISYTEILSYLVFGSPSFIVGGRADSDALRPVVSAILPTLGGAVEKLLADQIGFFDLFQIQAGSVGEQGVLQQRATDVLAGSRIGIGKQIGHRTFVTANAGLCRLLTGDQSFALGLTLEHRLNYGFSLQLGVEPASTALLCGRRGDLNTPRQVGIDLFREWSF